MNEQEYIEKWLNNSLTLEEKTNAAYANLAAELTRIQETSQQFRATDFNSELVFQNIKAHQNLAHAKRTGVRTLSSPLHWFLRIAAVLIVGSFGYYIFLRPQTQETVIATVDTTIKEAHLPDKSEVQLNAYSQITYDKGTWQKSRRVHLDGEGYFKVAKGKTFEVQTSQGMVAVLGTQFNIDARKGDFIVHCYEGSVRVVTEEKSYQLQAGTKLHRTKKSVVISDVADLQPDWLTQQTTFESADLGVVLKQLEKQFNITVINQSTTPQNAKFSGSFTHTNLERCPTKCYFAI